MSLLRAAGWTAAAAAALLACAVALEYVCLARETPGICPTAIAAPTIAHLRAVYEWCGARFADALGVLALLRLHLVWHAFARVFWAGAQTLPFIGVAHGFYARSTTYVFDHFWVSCILVGGGIVCALLLCASWWIRRRMAAPKKTRPVR